MKKNNRLNQLFLKLILAPMLLLFVNSGFAQARWQADVSVTSVSITAPV